MAYKWLVFGRLIFVSNTGPSFGIEIYNRQNISVIDVDIRQVEEVRLLVHITFY